MLLALLLGIGALFNVMGLTALLLALLRAGLQLRVVAIVLSAFFLYMVLAALSLSDSDAFLSASVGIFGSILVAAASDAKVFTSGSDE